jgi:hypothetical protein
MDKYKMGNHINFVGKIRITEILNLVVYKGIAGL